MSSSSSFGKAVNVSVRFEELLALCTHQIRHLRQLSSDDASAGRSALQLDDIYYRLRRWANEISCSNEAGQASAIEVIEALNGESHIAGKLHDILGAITAAVLELTQSSTLDFDPESIINNVAKLEQMSENVRSQFLDFSAQYKGESGPRSVVLSFGTQTLSEIQHGSISD